MKVPLVVPSVGEAVAAMRIVRWQKAVGATVVKNETLVEMTTDKVDFTIDAPESGELTEICAAAGTVVRPHDVIAIITHSET